MRHKPDGHCYLCGTPITVGRSRTREKSYTADQIREMVEAVKFEERCIVDPDEDDRDDFHEGWNAAIDHVLAQLEKP